MKRRSSSAHSGTAWMPRPACPGRRCAHADHWAHVVWHGVLLPAIVVLRAATICSLVASIRNPILLRVNPRPFGLRCSLSSCCGYDL